MSDPVRIDVWHRWGPRVDVKTESGSTYRISGDCEVRAARFGLGVARLLSPCARVGDRMVIWFLADDGTEERITTTPVASIEVRKAA